MKLKKQFSDFYDVIRIKEESQKLKDKREILQKDVEQRFPDEMKSHNIELYLKPKLRFLIREVIRITPQLKLL